MSAPQIAFRYAQALWELAVHAQTLAEVRADIAAIGRIIDEIPDIRRYCLGQHASQDGAAQLVESAFCPRIGALTADTLRLMVRNGRLAAVPLLGTAFAAMEARQSLGVEVILESSQAPGPELVALVSAAMAERTGREIRLVQRVCPELKGGFRILWQNKVIDHSVRGRLRALRSLLKSV